MRRNQKKRKKRKKRRTHTHGIIALHLCFLSNRTRIHRLSPPSLCNQPPSTRKSCFLAICWGWTSMWIIIISSSRTIISIIVLITITCIMAAPATISMHIIITSARNLHPTWSDTAPRAAAIAATVLSRTEQQQPWTAPANTNATFATSDSLDLLLFARTPTRIPGSGLSLALLKDVTSGSVYWVTWDGTCVDITSNKTIHFWHVATALQVATALPLPFPPALFWVTIFQPLLLQLLVQWSKTNKQTVNCLLSLFSISLSTTKQQLVVHVSLLYMLIYAEQLVSLEFFNNTVTLDI